MTGFYHQRICLAASRYLAGRMQVDPTFVKVLGIPETDPNCTDDRKIELIVSIGGRRLALEHTLIESFINQIGDGHHLQAFVRRVDEACGNLPGGSWTLAFDTKAVSGLTGASAQPIIAQLAEHIRDFADHKTAEETQGESFDIDGLHEEVRIWYRAGDQKPALQFSRLSPKDLEVQRIARIRQALQSKLPKLERWSHDGWETCLVLEDTDLALSTPHWVLGAVEAAASDVAYQLPDWILLVETPTEPTLWWTLSEQQRWSDRPTDTTGAVPIPAEWEAG